MDQHREQDSTQPIATDGRTKAVCDSPWGEVTLSLVFPYHLDWRKDFLPSDFSDVTVEREGKPETRQCATGTRASALALGRQTWNPFKLNSDAADGKPQLTAKDTAFQHWFNPSNYFHSSYLADRVVAGGRRSRFQSWSPSEKEAVAESGMPRWLVDVSEDFVLGSPSEDGPRIEVLAAERHEFDPVRVNIPGERTDDESDQATVTVDDGCGFAVVHLKLTGFTSDELTRASEFLLKPSFWSEHVGGKRRARGLSVDFTRILHGIGVHVQATRGGFTNSCVMRNRGSGELYWACGHRNHSKFEEVETTVPLSFWRQEAVCKSYFEGDNGPVTLAYMTGRLSVQADDGEKPARVPGRLPKAYNRVLGLWCLPQDDVRRPRPYNLFHLDPDGPWDEVRQWTYQLATGHRLSGTYSLPDDSLVEADRGFFRTMGCEVRVCGTGLAVMLNPQLSDSRREFEEFKGRAAENGRKLGEFEKIESYLSDTVVRSMVHGRFVDLAMLAIRQRFFLADHIEELARHHQRYEQGMEGRSKAKGNDIRSALTLEQKFQWFINQRWFDGVPGRPEATQVLTSFQRDWGVAEDIARVRDEQQGIFRLENFIHREAQERQRVESAERQRKAEVSRERERDEADKRFREEQARQAQAHAVAEERHREMQQQRERDRDAEERRHREAVMRREDEAAALQESRDEESRRRHRAREAFEYLAAIFAPPSLIFGALAVRGEPDFALFVEGLVYSGAVVIALVLIIFIRGRFKRSRGPESPRTPQAPRGNQSMDSESEKV